MSSKHRFAARRPRRTLAAPFVTTVLLGAASCSGGAGSSGNTTPPKQTARPGGESNPMVVVPSPPEPGTSKPGAGGAGGQGGTHKWHADPSLPVASGVVTYMIDGSCMGTIPFECPKAEPGKARPTCNPPPPRAVRCPDAPSPAEIASARKQSLQALSDCAKGKLPQSQLSVEVSAAGKCEDVQTIVGKLDPKLLDCTREKLKKLGWPLHTRPYRIEIISK